MTLGEMETRARDIVADCDEPYRFDAGFVLTALCEGIERLRSIRPESRYFGLSLYEWVRPTGVAETGMTVAQIATARAVVPYFDARWNEAIPHFAAAKIYEADETDTANAQLSADNMAKFEKLALT